MPATNSRQTLDEAQEPSGILTAKKAGDDEDEGLEGDDTSAISNSINDKSDSSLYKPGSKGEDKGNDGGKDDDKDEDMITGRHINHIRVSG
ncbi:uncharacterized protein E0L32_001141 [Thyridium curvatum]|uniref:Uncharacterized protein n=1 Tax=Thyridium curvatum TaxID=1093900 RepID=A0A507AUB0_9PEZI|nr:uncharacterized protein E0L32_001141 [Thyridium curvatum]TPX11323.1 hypothetical protein E0L32_001141 [Thyridium curvatum]